MEERTCACSTAFTANLGAMKVSSTTTSSSLLTVSQSIYAQHPCGETKEVRG